MNEWLIKRGNGPPVLKCVIIITLHYVYNRGIYISGGVLLLLSPNLDNCDFVFSLNEGKCPFDV